MGASGASFLQPGDRAALERIVGADQLYIDQEWLARYGRDTCDMFEPAPSVIVFPGNTEQIRDVVLLANDRNLALIPSGGRTGLSGGATACHGEIVVSMERMNQILDASNADRTIRCQAGVVTARVQERAREMGLYYPVDFAAAGSSHIAGNIATNAGGTRVIRYGMTRNWVAAIEVVTGAGDVIRLGRGLLKDNTGYDMHQLFIGSEGTLGFISEATVRLTRPPADPTVMVLGLECLADLLPVLAAFEAEVTVNAFEFFTSETLARVIERHELQRPFDTSTPVYTLIEFESRSDDDMQSALGAFEACMGKGWVSDGTVSQNLRQAADLWRLRDDISGTLARWSPYKNDLSVRVSLVPQFLEAVAQFVAEDYGDFEVLWYGHVGDGNVHINILKPDQLPVEDFKARCSGVSERLFQLVNQYKGSVSAEHGVGLLKKPYLSCSRSKEEIRLMRTIKGAFDPNAVMNPGKLFD